jgi:hypothetical protein
MPLFLAPSRPGGVGTLHFAREGTLFGGRRNSTGHFSRFATEKLLDLLERLDRKVTIRISQHHDWSTLGHDSTP